MPAAAPRPSTRHRTIRQHVAGTLRSLLRPYFGPRRPPQLQPPRPFCDPGCSALRLLRSSRETGERLDRLAQCLQDAGHSIRQTAPTAVVGICRGSGPRNVECPAARRSATGSSSSVEVCSLANSNQTFGKVIAGVNVFRFVGVVPLSEVDCALQLLSNLSPSPTSRAGSVRPAMANRQLLRVVTAAGGSAQSLIQPGRFNLSINRFRAAQRALRNITSSAP